VTTDDVCDMTLSTDCSFKRLTRVYFQSRILVHKKENLKKNVKNVRNAIEVKKACINLE